jgi:DNA-directed RNA polymerase specialized sigma24 family protein
MSVTEVTASDGSDAAKQQNAFPVDDQAFVEELWKQYYTKLKLAVAGRVNGIRRPVANESEIALSAFHSFVQRAQAGQFPDLADHDALWRLLKTIAIRKANDTRKKLRALKRGGDQAIYGQSDLAQDDQRLTGVDAAAARVDSPSLDAEVADLFNSLLSKLPDDRHRDVILLKLQGAPVATIAEYLETSTRTVHRLLKQIEEDWQGELTR